METSEIDLIVSKNQLSFDFESVSTGEEEQSSLPSTAFETQEFDWVKEKTLFVAIDVKGNSFCLDLKNLMFCGKSPLEWLVMASGGCETKVIEDDDNIIARLKQIQTDKEFIAVFYSDTPLVDKTLFARIMNYFSRNRLNGMSLPRGYVFRTSFLSGLEDFMGGLIEKFEEKAFTQLSSADSYNEIYTTLKGKILNYHIAGGVVILDKETTVIDADVEIESGVIIHPNNVLLDGTIVEENVILFEGNRISQSIIGKGARLCGCVISKSKVGDVKLSAQVLNSEQV